MLTGRRSCLLAAVGGVFLSGGCRQQDTNTENAVAVYSYSAGPYSETVTLRPDGKYVQSETQRGGDSALGPQESTSSLPLKTPSMTFKQSGAWRLLDGPGGRPLPRTHLAQCPPPGAVVELHKAMPFGPTWENRPPGLIQSDRTIPAGEFSLQHQVP